MVSSLARAYTNKADMYDCARPLYPQSALLFIRENIKSTLDLPILDVGSGTGILTRQMAAIGMLMIGVEPDEHMLAKAIAHDRQLKNNYHRGTAEHLGLGSKTIGALVCGQSFHWFDTDKARTEFLRVLATDNPVFLIWNIRSADHDEFHCAYEELLNKNFKRYKETLQVDSALDSKIQSFFNGNCQEKIFQNLQHLSEAGLIHRTMSCSYASQIGTDEYYRACEALSILHRDYQVKEAVLLHYKTRVVYGRI